MSEKKRDEIIDRIDRAFGRTLEDQYESSPFAPRWSSNSPPIPDRNLGEAESKLAEYGIIWEDGKGYVFNGKE